MNFGNTYGKKGPSESVESSSVQQNDEYGLFIAQRVSRELVTVNVDYAFLFEIIVPRYRGQLFVRTTQSEIATFKWAKIHGCTGLSFSYLVFRGGGFLK